MIWLILACTSSPVLDGAAEGPFHEAAPRITDVDVACDTDEAEWTFEVRTENWTGGGWIWMAKAEDNAEGHKNRSRRAAADGSSDFLQLKLTIEADWRDAQRNTSTRWLCSDWPELTFMATAYDPTGSGVGIDTDGRNLITVSEVYGDVQASSHVERITVDDAIS